MHKIIFLLLPLLASACQAPMPPQPTIAPAPTRSVSAPPKSQTVVTPTSRPAPQQATPRKQVVVSNLPAPEAPSKPGGLRARTDLTFSGGGAASGPAVIDLR